TTLAEVPAVAEDRTSPGDCDERYRQPPPTISVSSHGCERRLTKCTLTLHTIPMTTFCRICNKRLSCSECSSNGHFQRSFEAARFNNNGLSRKTQNATPVPMCQLQR